jgi:hypothetical protein
MIIYKNIGLDNIRKKKKKENVETSNLSLWEQVT